MALVLGVLTQHLEEAAFQWLLRDLAVSEPHYTLDDLTRLDGRVEAHLNGLRIGGGEAWSQVSGEVGWEEPGDAFVAVGATLGLGDPEPLDQAVDAATGRPSFARGAISALGWMGLAPANDTVDRLIASDHPWVRTIGIGGAAVNRHDPGPALAEAIGADEIPPRSRALKAAGELGRLDLLSHCARFYEADDLESRFWAAYSAALLGDANGGSRTLYHISLDVGPYRERAADLVARVMPTDRVHAWHQNLAAEAETVRLGCVVARALGDPALVPWLIEVMLDENHTRVAGEAFSSITGADLPFLDLDQNRPEGLETGPNDDPADEDVAMDADDELPWPDPDLVAKWWQANGAQFSAGTRYLRGQPITPESCGSTLRDGMQRQRVAAALELALAQPGKPLFETRARGDWQKAWLGLAQ